MRIHQFYKPYILGKRQEMEQVFKFHYLHGMADWMNVPYLQTVYGKRSIKRVGLSHPSIAPYGAYYSKCGKKILISIQNEREWVNLCKSVLMLNNLYTDIKV